MRSGAFPTVCIGIGLLLMATLAGAAQAAPLVIGHRGAPGYLPEHTLESYELAIDQGANFIEPDLVISSDGILFARHENNISGTTDVAKKFPKRGTTKTVDGREVRGWFLEDFTSAEIRTLRAKERLAFRNQSNNGRYRIPTLEDVIALVKRKGRKLGRVIGIYPETKHPTYFRRLGLPLEPPLVKLLRDEGYDRRDAPVFIQSFEVGNLKALKRMIAAPLIQLIGRPDRQPYDFVSGGDSRTYRDLLRPEGLKKIARYARGIGPNKQALVAGMEGNSTRSPLVEAAHRAGLLVHTWTFRNETRFVLKAFKGDPAAELRHFFRLGVDGVFSDFPDVGVAARKAFSRDGK